MPSETASGAVNTLVVVGALLIIGLVVISSVYAASPTETHAVDDENVTVDYQNKQQLDPGEEVFSWSDTITVNASDGTTLTEGTDYEYYSNNGSIQFLNTSATTEGNTATVDYEYEAPPQMAQSVIGPISSSFDLGSVLPIVIVAGAILAYLRGFGSGGSRR